jgi:hypothetical protein
MLNTNRTFEKIMKLLHFLLILVSINCRFIPKPEKGKEGFLKFLNFIDTSGNLTVSSTQPKKDTTNIYLNTNIFVGLNKTLSTIDETNFSVIDEGKTSHPGKLSINDNFLTFTPNSNFKEFTKYTISIKKEIGLSGDFSSSFTTGNLIDNTPPFVISTSPSEGDKDFPLNATVVFNFSETIDPTSVTSQTFTISGGVSADRISDGQFASLKPKTNLSELSPYIVTIKAGVKDLAGNKTTAPYSILFSTANTIMNDSCVYDEGLFNACLYR